MSAKKEFIKEFIRDELAKKLKEKGIKAEIHQESDLVIKSGDLKIGVVYILSPDDEPEKLLDKVKNIAGSQVYILLEKQKEKDLVAQSISKGLAGKIKFISWELKFYGL
ncbi:MAG: hypothetical protein NZ927_02135 [Candidatus Calescibacterium sp.]|nr:hypothetical protein [Candidatus Calescibacterium sp.]MCX7734375.1 hypothetical protein [bacterium]MDW8086861.1 hypothetical protein [Candidatus Calescibacterium sp.]